MGYDVFTSIMFPAHDRVYHKDERVPSPFAEIAEKHLEILKEDICVSNICIRFLIAVKEGRCLFGGSKGDGICFAAEGNGGNAEGVADELKPYFLDMWRNRIIAAYHGIILTSNGESEAKTQVIELRLTEEAEGKVRYGKELTEEDIVIRKFEEEWFVKFPNR